MASAFLLDTPVSKEMKALANLSWRGTSIATPLCGFSGVSYRLFCFFFHFLLPRYAWFGMQWELGGCKAVGLLLWLKLASGFHVLMERLIGVSSHVQCFLSKSRLKSPACVSVGSWDWIALIITTGMEQVLSCIGKSLKNSCLLLLLKMYMASGHQNMLKPWGKVCFSAFFPEV